MTSYDHMENHNMEVAFQPIYENYIYTYQTDEALAKKFI